MTRPKVMLFTDWFLPAYKAGGPVRSTVNFVETLEDCLDIYVVTGNTDLGDSNPLSGIKSNTWQTFSNSKVIYLSKSNQTKSHFRKIITEIKPDFIYLNSMFSFKFTMLPLWNILSGSFEGRLILAPRGMLRKSALAVKSGKKRIFLSLFNFFGFHKKILFHATDRQEEEDVKNIFGTKTKVFNVSNLPSKSKTDWTPTKKEKSKLNLAFIGRIHPIKNLDFFLKILREWETDISPELHIYGNMEDKNYWQKCQSIIQDLPANFTVRFYGETAPSKIRENLKTHHILILPTKGENFGHAIFEALQAGKPVLISDQTPWRNLTNQKAGWDIALSQPKKFSDAVEFAARMDQKTYNEWSNAAFQFASDYVSNSNLKEKYKKLFS